MNLHSDAREFLKSRRDRVTPQAAGLPSYGRNRRVPGLRREEVALLAGVSVDYYTRLERGNLSGASEEVLAAVAGALQLDEAERSHLFDLAKATNSQSLRRRNTRGATRAQEKVRPEVQRILDAMADTPAFILTDRADMLTTNQLGRALFAPLYDSPVSPGTSGQAETVNIARFTFLDPVAREFFPHWEHNAADLATSLRSTAGRHPHDTVFSNLIGELATRSQDFAQLWADHNVRLHRVGRKTLHHPIVGDLELDFETLILPADPDQSLIVYSAAPGSDAAQNLRLLASWTVTGTDKPGTDRAFHPADDVPSLEE